MDQLIYTPTFELKALTEEGTFEGILSAYGVEDLYGDVIDKGAFRKTLAEQPVVPLLWQHDRKEVIGEAEVAERGSKILMSGALDMEDPVAVRVYGKLKKRLVKGLSIGFQTLKSTFEEVTVEGVKKYIRHIQELKLWEGSVVTFPALPMAAVTRVKAVDLGSWEAELIEDIRSASPDAINRIKALLANEGREAGATPDGAGAISERAAAAASEPEDFHSLNEELKGLIRYDDGRVRGRTEVTDRHASGYNQ